MGNAELSDIADLLEDRDDFAVYYHKNPDGDAVGSAFALVMALKAMKKNACAVCCDPVPENYRFLTDKTGNAHFHPRINIAVDTATPDRLGEYSDLKFSAVIDHHEKNTIDAALKYVVPGASSCAELVYELIRELGVPVSSVMADLLFLGLVTDTCCFCTPSVTAATYRTAYELAALGADCVLLSRRFCYEKDRRRMMIENRMYSSMVYREQGQIAAAVLSHGDFEELGITPEDLEGINEIADRVKGMKIGIIVRERYEGKCRVSVRTSGKADAAEFCGLYGGGGHRHAGGMECEGTAAEVRERVLGWAEEYLKQKTTLL